jgi:hypothetical protein
LIVKGAASVEALASFHANSQSGVDATMYAVNSAKIVTKPGDGDGSVPNPNGHPDGELYLLMDVGVLGSEDNGHGAIVGRIGYQANVLVQNTEPDLDSILLSLAGQDEFLPALSVSVTGCPGFILFDLKVTLTGPMPQGNNPFFGVVLDSDHLQDVPVAQLLVVHPGGCQRPATKQHHSQHGPGRNRHHYRHESDDQHTAGGNHQHFTK